MTEVKKTVALVTGANGFIGRNLLAVLNRQEHIEVVSISRSSTPDELAAGLKSADVVFHLAGVNRPETEAEFAEGNADFTAEICNQLLANGRAVPIIYTSSAQAELDNPYGISKRDAEEHLKTYVEKSGGFAAIFRLKSVFGKWCRPNYNSVVATFCHNISHDLPITISDPTKEVSLVYIDDVVQSFLQYLPNNARTGVEYPDVLPVYSVTLGRLAELLRSFREMRQNLLVPNFADDFTLRLYATFLSYLAKDDFGYDLSQRCDPRGSLAEFVKSPSFGQVFVSRTHPGITRGNHYHHTKAEKFFVVEGQAVVRFRSILNGEVLEYKVEGKDFRVIDIPPGYTHSIENVGQGELVTLFWSNEVFDPARTDTNPLTVFEEAAS